MDNCFSFLVRYPEDLTYLESIRPSDAVYRVGNQLAVVVYCGIGVMAEENLPYGAVPRCFGLADITHLTAMGIPQTESLPGFDLYGNGVILGMVDTGINYRESVFKRRDGSNRVLTIWDQEAQYGTNEATGDTLFIPFGTVYSEAEIHAETVLANDEDGHGTYLASVAAGGAFRGTQQTSTGDSPIENRGVAPECELAVVKLRQAKEVLRDYWRIDTDAPCYSETDVILGIQYLVRFAQSQNKPLVLLLALESNSGPHNGAGLFDGFLDRLSQQRGIAVVIAAGNEGNAAHHYESRSVPDETDNGADEAEEVVFAVNGTRQMSLEVWGRLGDLYAIDLVSPGGNQLGMVPPVTEGILSRSFLLEGTQVVVAYQVPERQTGEELIFIRFRNLTDGIWTLRVYPRRVLTGRNSFHVWLPITGFLHGNTSFLRPEPDVTVTEPGNSSLSLTFGAYDDLSGGILANSGRGYPRNGGIKPDLASPGYRIPGITGLPVFGEPTEGGYVLRSGTSVAAACGAGATILMMEWGIVRENLPYLRGTEIKSFFINGAVREERTYPNREWGFGALNLLGAFREIR